MPLRRRLCSLVAALAALLPGCATQDNGANYSASESYVGQLIRQSSESALRVRWYDDVNQLLDNTHYVTADFPTGPVTDAVIVGSVEQVLPGYGFWLPGGDAPRGTQTSFGDPRSMWRTVHVQLSVDELLSGDVGRRNRVFVGFSFAATADFERIRNDFMSMPALVLFLRLGSPVFDYDDTLYSVLEGGVFLGAVTESERIEFVGLSLDEAIGLNAEDLTLDDIRRAAEQPRRTITVP